MKNIKRKNFIKRLFNFGIQESESIFRITNNGNIGITSIVPSVKLEIKNNII